MRHHPTKPGSAVAGYAALTGLIPVSAAAQDTAHRHDVQSRVDHEYPSLFELYKLLTSNFKARRSAESPLRAK